MFNHYFLKTKSINKSVATLLIATLMILSACNSNKGIGYTNTKNLPNGYPVLKTRGLSNNVDFYYPYTPMPKYPQYHAAIYGNNNANQNHYRSANAAPTGNYSRFKSRGSDPYRYNRWYNRIARY